MVRYSDPSYLPCPLDVLSDHLVKYFPLNPYLNPTGSFWSELIGPIMDGCETCYTWFRKLEHLMIGTSNTSSNNNKHIKKGIVVFVFGSMSWLVVYTYWQEQIFVFANYYQLLGPCRLSRHSINTQPIITQLTIHNSLIHTHSTQAPYWMMDGTTWCVLINTIATPNSRRS